MVVGCAHFIKQIIKIFFLKFIEYFHVLHFFLQILIFDKYFYFKKTYLFNKLRLHVVRREGAKGAKEVVSDGRDETSAAVSISDARH